MTNPRERHAVTIFFILSFALSILAALVMHMLATSAGLKDFSELMSLAETEFALGTIANKLPFPAWLVYLISRVVDFGPTIAGLATALWVGGMPEFNSLLKRIWQLAGTGKAYLWAFLIPIGILAAAFLLHVGLGDSKALAGANWQGFSTIGSLLFWVFVARTLLGGGLGEEVGWRGFALPRLQTRYGAFRASLIIGVVWSLWHFPVVFIADEPIVQAVVLLLFIIPQSFTYTWVYNMSKGSLLPVILMHGATNGLSAFLERSLFPPLLEEDGFVIFLILGTLVVGIVMAFLVRRQGKGVSK